MVKSISEASLSLKFYNMICAVQIGYTVIAINHERVVQNPRVLYEEARNQQLYAESDDGSSLDRWLGKPFAHTVHD